MAAELVVTVQPRAPRRTRSKTTVRTGRCRSTARWRSAGAGRSRALPADVAEAHYPVTFGHLEEVGGDFYHLIAPAGGRYAAATSRPGIGGVTGGMSVSWSVLARRTARSSDSSSRLLAWRRLNGCGSAGNSCSGDGMVGALPAIVNL